MYAIIPTTSIHRDRLGRIDIQIALLAKSEAEAAQSECRFALEAIPERIVAFLSRAGLATIAHTALYLDKCSGAATVQSCTNIV